MKDLLATAGLTFRVSLSSWTLLARCCLHLKFVGVSYLTSTWERTVHGAVELSPAEVTWCKPEMCGVVGYWTPAKYGEVFTGGMTRCNSPLHSYHIVFKVQMWIQCIQASHVGDIQNVSSFHVTFWIHFECRMYPACIHDVTPRHMGDTFGP